MAKRKSQPRGSQQSPPRRSGASSSANKPDRAGNAPGNSPGDGEARRRRSEIRLRQVPGKQQWELVHPRAVRDRAEDLEEVRLMIDAGEDEIATEELRWLLDGCSDFIEAHKMLGELALTAGDFKLARGHFGYAFDIGIVALPAAGLSGPLAYERPANQPFFEATKGLAWCFIQLDMPERARELLDGLLRLDPSDPLGAAEMRSQLDRPAAE